jgi:micrococcal nuclease
LGSFRVAGNAVATGVAVLALIGCAPADTAPANSSARTTATVAWVSDGDTLRLTNGRKVRLLQIDAPEKEADCYGHEATRVLVKLAPKGTRVTLESDSLLDDKDTYGRLLRYVHVGGTNVNLTLVERGAAAPYYFRKERGHYASEFLAAAKRARSERRGFWKSCPGAELNPGLGSVTGPTR